MAKGNKQTLGNRAGRLGQHARTGGPGRPKGSKNLTSREAQQRILDTLAKLDKAKKKDGTKKYPEGYLHHLAEEEPKTFAALFGRCLPRDMTLDATIGFDWEGLVKAWNRGREKAR